ncbi:MAG: DUF5684 domain-containing protein [Candidatus Saccharibacteria bacterium]
MELLASIGIVAIVFWLSYFFSFCYGLAKIFHQAGIARWKAFIPVFNFAFLVDLTGLPRSYFWLSLVPWIGTVYAFMCVMRLAKAYGKDIIFTSAWLTLAIPIGLNVLTLNKATIDTSVFSEPIMNLDELKKIMKKSKSKKSKATKS